MQGVLISVLAFVISQTLAQGGTLVTIDDGPVQGFLKTSYDGRGFLAFEGIPYAQPPVDQLRYNPPQLPKPWTETLMGNTTYVCMQNVNFYVMGVEDCLYLNVYVPREVVDATEKFEVLVHFHGGAFTMGAPDWLAGPGKVMDRDIILVSVNYRVGALGFLSYADRVIPGNYGLKDQAFSLQWVKNNIQRFGGNPDSVTITGASAGAASTHLHYFSPLSKGLFHRGFGQSGTALNPGIINPQPRVNADKYLTEVGCIFETSEAILECLQEASAYHLVLSFGALYEPNNFNFPAAPFAPVIEIHSEEAFLVEDPLQQILSKRFYDVPLLLSVTTEEGLSFSVSKLEDLDELNDNWNKWGPLILNYYYLEEEERNALSSQLMRDYFNNEEITLNNFHILVDLCTTRLFHFPAQNTSLLQGSASQSGVYYFKMRYGTESSGWEWLWNTNLTEVVDHGDDAIFYYDVSSPNIELSEKQERMKNILLDMLYSFLTTNIPVIPNIDWMPVQEDSILTYLVIRGPEEIQIVTRDVAFGKNNP